MQGSSCVRDLDRVAGVDRGPALFDGDRFRQIARLVDVAAAADCDVIGEKLQRDDFQQRGENFRSRGKLDDVIGRLAGEMVASR